MVDAELTVHLIEFLILSLQLSKAALGLLCFGHLLFFSLA